MTEQAAPTAVDKQGLREEVESTRKAFHELLDSLSEQDWKKKSANQAWSVRQLMWHMAWGLDFTPRGVDYCRRGKAPNPPSWLVGPGNVLITRFGSRRSTPESVAGQYERGHAAILHTLDSVGDDEWGKAVRAYGVDYTIESLFREVTHHFREHKEDILKGLGRL